MHQMARAVKPLLGMVPPDPASLAPRDLQGARAARRALPRPRRRAVPRAAQAPDDELGGLSRRMVRDRSAQGDEVGERHHRHVPGPALARHGVRAAASLHGRDRRRLPRVGFRERRQRLGERGDRGGGARARRGDPHRARRSSACSCATAARRASCSRTAKRSRRTIVVSSADPRRTFLRARRRASTCRTISSRRSSASSSAARRAR